jgi:hypothetical protein
MHARFARLHGARLGARQVEYSAGQVSPTALVAALGRAGVEADTLNSVAGKLLAAPYLRGGVSLDALGSSSLLRDRDMHGGAVKAAAILAVRRALAVRLRVLGPPFEGHARWGRLFCGRWVLEVTPPPGSAVQAPQLLCHLLPS